MLPTEYSFITPLNESWKTTLADTDFLFLTATQEDAAVPTNFIKAVANQDKLLLYAISRANETFGLPQDKLDIPKFITNFGAISDNATKVSVVEDIRTLLDKLYLTKVPYGSTDINPRGSVSTKIAAIVGGTVEDTIGALLLYPARVTNIFISSLAAIFYQIKQDSKDASRLLTPENINNTPLRELLKRHYSSYVNTNAYSLTGTGLRDSYSVFNKTSFASEVLMDFFDKFLLKYGVYQTPSSTTLLTATADGGCKNLLITGAFTGTPAEDNIILDSVADIAASLLIEFIKTENSQWTVANVLKKFKLSGNPLCSSSTIETKAATKFGDIPFTETQKTAPIAETDGVTLQMLFRQMNYPAFYFVIQLVQAVADVITSETEATGAPAPAPASST